MSVIRNGFFNRMTNSKVNTDQALLQQELVFADQIEAFHSPQINSPIMAFLIPFDEPSLTPTFTSQKDQVSRTFMILMELEDLIKNNSGSSVFINNILSVLDKNPHYTIRNKLNYKGKEAIRYTDDIAFRLPTNTIMLQKKGNFFKKSRFRHCFMTINSFGQIKNMDKRRLFKPAYFREQYVTVDFKNKTLQDIARESEKKKRGQTFRKILSWPDKKEIKKYVTRVSFEEIKNNKRRAVYVNSVRFATSLKNHTITQRILANDIDKKNRITVFVGIWKIKQFEFFYKRFFKTFFDDRNDFRIHEEDNINIEEKVREYLRNNQVENDAKNKYNFHNNDHLAVGEERPIEKDEFGRNFATIVEKDFHFQNQSEVIKNFDIGTLRSPFEDIDDTIIFDQVEFDNYISNFSLNLRNPNVLNGPKQSFIENVMENSKMILKLNKILLGRIHEQQVIDITEEDFNDLFLSVGLGNERGEGSSSFALVENVKRTYVTLETDNSLTVDSRDLQKLELIINDEYDKKTLFSGEIDLLKAIDNVYLENILHIRVLIDYRGRVVPMVVQFLLILVPKNLETAHFTLNKKHIETNFTKFQEILYQSIAYKPYKYHFFPDAYLRSFDYKKNDFFYFLNNCLPIKDIYVEDQVALFANGNQRNQFDWLVSILKLVLTENTDLMTGLMKCTDYLEKGGNLTEHVYFDAASLCLDLISPKTRLFLHFLTFNNFNKFYFNFDYALEKQEYQPKLIKELFQALQILLNGEFSFLQADERYLVYKLTFEIHLLFENNNFNGKNYPIKLSEKHLPIIIKIVQLNSFDLEDEDIKLIVINSILNASLMKRFTPNNQIMYIDSMVIYFKVLFKSLYPDFYRGFTNKMLNFDSILYKVFMNSFSDYFDTINFNIFGDIKLILQTFFLMKGSSFNEGLDSIEIRFHSLLDILFALQALITNYDAFTNIRGNDFVKTIEQCFRKESLNLEENLKKTIELLSCVSKKNFLKKEFELFKITVKQTHDVRMASLRLAAVDFRSVGIDYGKLQDIIETEIGQNNTFILRALGLFKQPAQKQTGSMKESELEEDRDSYKELIEEDIYFEIDEDFDEGYNEELTVLRKKQDVKYTNCLIYLNNLDYNSIDGSAGSASLKSNFNNIYELSQEEVVDFAKRYFQTSDLERTNIFSNLERLSNEGKMPLLRLIIIMICTCADGRREIISLLRYLAETLTNLFYRNSKGLFNEVVMYIIDEVNNLSPITYFNGFMHNLIENEEKENFCYIKTAQIDLIDDMVDVHQLCIKTFSSSSYLHGKPTMTFNINFCKNLEAIFTDLVQNNKLEPDFKKFTLFLEVSDYGQIRYFSVPFRITFIPEINIVCKLKSPLIFEKELKNDFIVEERVLDKYILDSPFCFFGFSTSAKLPLNFIRAPLLLKYIYNKENFFSADVTFIEKDNRRTCSDLISWRYANPDAKKLTRFASSGVSIVVHYSFFFLNIEELIRMLNIAVVEKLSEGDILRFVKLNSGNITFSNEKGKGIASDSHFYELAGYSDALKRRQPFVFSVNYK